MASSNQGGLATPPPDSPNQPFDIVSHYNRLITTDPSITPPIAAIESLIATLSSSPLTTISETLSLLTTASNTLLSSQSNPIPLSAGTELLQRYIVTSFQSQPAQLSGNDFTALRRQLISNSKLFVSRTKSARSKIARHALGFLRDGTTVVAYGSSRVVAAILDGAAEAKRDFRVIFVASSGGEGDGEGGSESTTLEQATKRLLAMGVPVATVSFPALSHTLASLPREMSKNVLFLLGAEAVLENGATVSNMGSHLVASVAKQSGIPCYFVAESYKFTRQYPTAFGDQDLRRMGAKQETLVLRTRLDEEKEFDITGQKSDGGNGMVDITPPGLISGLITESGIMTCEGVAEELIKLWF